MYPQRIHRRVLKSFIIIAGFICASSLAIQAEGSVRHPEVVVSTSDFDVLSTNYAPEQGLLLPDQNTDLEINRTALITGAVAEGNALQFDGNDEVVIPHANNISFSGNATMTVELWFMPTSTQSTYHLLGKRSGCTEAGNNYQIARDRSGLLHLNSGGDVVSANVDPAIDQWTHIAVTYDGTTLKVYVNGALEVTSVFAITGENTVPLKLGSSGTCSVNTRFGGLIDEVRIWNVERTEAEIAGMYDRIINPETPGLVGYWNFDDTSVDQTVFDLSSFDNHGTLGSDVSIASDDPVYVASTAPLSLLEYDVAVDDIRFPQGDVTFQSRVTPEVIVHNLGLNTETISTNLKIGSFYDEDNLITLAPGESGVVSFPDWEANTLGSFNIESSVFILNDEFEANNRLTNVVAVVADPTAPIISGISPIEGGDTGTVTMTVNGKNFQEGIEASLEGPGVIMGDVGQVSEDGRTITVTFDLTGQPHGLWNVVVINPEGNRFILFDAFNISEGVSAEVWVDILGRDIIRSGRKHIYAITYGNTGNIDAIGVPIWVDGIPTEAQIETDFEIFLPRQESNGIDWSVLPRYHESEGEVTLPLIIPLIPAGGTETLQIALTMPTSSNFELEVWTNPVHFNSFVDESENSNISAKMASLPSLRVSTVDAAECIQKSVIKFAGVTPVLSCTIGVIDKSTQRIFDAIYGLPVMDQRGFLFEVLWDCVDPIEKLPVSKKLQVLKEAYQGYQELSSLLDIGESCSKSFLPTGNSSRSVSTVGSLDPNDKVGSEGVGSSGYVTGEEPLRYVVQFENVESASAPAQEVVITDQLESSNLDLHTFSFGLITFGDRQVILPTGLQAFTREVDLRPEKNLIVRIEGTLETTTGLVTWRFTSIDPATGELPEDPFAGFLPPNVNPPEGEGSVLFTVMPKEELSTGNEIRNAASIVFDVNEPINTPEWVNTVDNTKPSSRVLPLDAVQNDTSFDIEWSGSDIGAGIRDYALYVSEEGSPFGAIAHTSATSTSFTGEPGKTYAFYTVARDGTGNREDIPEAPEAITTVATPAQLSCDPVAISDFEADQEEIGNAEDDIGEYIDLSNNGSSSASLAGCTLAFFDGATSSSYFSVQLSGSIDSGEIYRIGNSGVDGVDQTFPEATLQNGPDAITVLDRSADEVPAGTNAAEVAADVVASVVYIDENTIFGQVPAPSGKMEAAGDLATVLQQAVDQRKPGSSLPESFALQQNYPNPFNPTTNIRFAVPEASHVTVVIFDLLGREVQTLVNEQQEAGAYTVTWDGKNEQGMPVPSGTYIYRMRAGDFVDTKTMLLLK